MELPERLKKYGVPEFSSMNAEDARFFCRYYLSLVMEQQAFIQNVLTGTMIEQVVPPAPEVEQAAAAAS